MLRINDWRAISGFDYQKTQSELGKHYFLFYLLLKDSSFSLTTLEGFFLVLSPHLSHEPIFLTKAAVTMYEILGS